MIQVPNANRSHPHRYSTCNLVRVKEVMSVPSRLSQVLQAGRNRKECSTGTFASTGTNLDQTSPLALRIVILDLENNTTRRHNIMVTFESITHTAWGTKLWAAVHPSAPEPEKSFIDAVRNELGEYLLNVDSPGMYTPAPYGMRDLDVVYEKVFNAAAKIAAANNAQAYKSVNEFGAGLIFLLRNYTTLSLPRN